MRHILMMKLNNVDTDIVEFWNNSGNQLATTMHIDFLWEEDNKVMHDKLKAGEMLAIEIREA